MPSLNAVSAALSSLLKMVGAKQVADYLRFHFMDSPVPAYLPEDLRTDIQSAKRFMLKTKRLPNPADLFGYKIKFMGAEAFKYLANEVFFEPSYFFESKSESPLILDCGSNIGMSVLFFKKLYPKARIIAFEPDPFTFETLSANISQNNLLDVQAHQAALAAFDGEIELFRDRSPASSSLLMSTIRQRHDGPALKVPALKLSPFITSEVDLIKLDIEGAEGAVLRELADARKLQFVKRIHLEYHHHIDKSADNLSVLLRLMEENQFGYQLRSLPHLWPREHEFQDVSFYFYRK